MHGEEDEVLDGTQLAADWTFSGLQKFGQGMLDRLRGLRLNNKLLEKVSDRNEQSVHCGRPNYISKIYEQSEINISWIIFTGFDLLLEILIIKLSLKLFSLYAELEICRELMKLSSLLIHYLTII